MTAQKPLAQKNHLPLPRENHAYEPSLENIPLMIPYLGHLNAPLFARQNITNPSSRSPYAWSAQGSDDTNDQQGFNYPSHNSAHADTTACAKAHEDKMW